MDKVKLRRHETFCIREGWIQKGLGAINEYGNETFQREKGIKILGLGSNMVKSLKYWMIASHVIKSQPVKVELTEFGDVLWDEDRYLEDDFSWCLFHYFLSTDFEESPVIYYITNVYRKKIFNKEELCDEIYDHFKVKGYDSNKALILEDINMYIRLYQENRTDNPEENTISPLASLKLLESGLTSNDFTKTSIDPEKLDYRIVFYALERLYDKQFEVNAALADEKSPVKVFTLDKGIFSQYLNIMRNEGLITINKTAGLNTVNINRKIELPDLYRDYKNQKGGN